MSERDFHDEAGYIRHRNRLIQSRNESSSQFERDVLNKMIADLPESYTEAMNKYNSPSKKSLAENRKTQNKTIIIQSIILSVVFFFLFVLGALLEFDLEWFFEELAAVISALIATIFGIIILVKLIKAIVLRYKLSIAYREKCYKKIDRIRSYLDRGSITEEEFNSLKQDILNKIG